MKPQNELRSHRSPRSAIRRTVFCGVQEDGLSSHHSPPIRQKIPIQSTGHETPTGAFSLVELLVTFAIISILAAITLPSITRARQTADAAQCMSQLRQIGLATQLYWEDFNGRAFPERFGQTNGGWVYWFGWLGDGAEGSRLFDSALGPLWPYIKDRNLSLCPSLKRSANRIKWKAKGAASGYAYNLLLGPRHQPPVQISHIRHPSQLAVFADAAQINDFQAPASPENPMLEEFYFFSTHPGEATVHFRHHERTQVWFADGHIGRENVEPGTEDLRLLPERLGRLPKDRVIPH